MVTKAKDVVREVPRTLAAAPSNSRQATPPCLQNSCRTRPALAPKIFAGFKNFYHC